LLSSYDFFGNRVREIKKVKGEIVEYMDSFYRLSGHLSRDIVFTGAGEDKKWFTDDDLVGKYHRFDYGKRCVLERCLEYFPTDGRPNRRHNFLYFPPHNAIHATRVYVYNRNGMLEQIKKYNGAGPDQQWSTSDDLLQYYEKYVYKGKHT
jgi:hypothetical protein